MNKIILLSLCVIFAMSCGEKASETTDNQADRPTITRTTAPTKTPAIQQSQRPRPTQTKAKSPINWMSFEEAQAAMKKEPKKMFVDVYTHWCGPCKMLDRNTFANPQVADYVNENYYAVKFNAQDENDIQFGGKTFSNPNYDPNKGQYRRNATNQLAGAMGVRAFPTMIIINEELQIMHSIRGMKQPQQLLPILQQFASM